ncbi:hypothetical protein ADUPG1_010453 [Aduncisulcus paluster]|uniref:Tetratricopeptide repeat (TPR)-like superfamily protein n=1 Tax=Aduncisulcus paluster TaxID=2918883 RepID=A0ABQ5JV52_9EUKA|nr:hypothetical protein ADUPG1_010453 [Aduncisulcus paluster]
MLATPSISMRGYSAHISRENVTGDTRSVIPVLDFSLIKPTCPLPEPPTLELLHILDACKAATSSGKFKVALHFLRRLIAEWSDFVSPEPLSASTAVSCLLLQSDILFEAEEQEAALSVAQAAFDLASQAFTATEPEYFASVELLAFLEHVVIGDIAHSAKLFRSSWCGRRRVCLFGALGASSDTALSGEGSLDDADKDAGIDNDFGSEPRAMSAPQTPRRPPSAGGITASGITSTYIQRVRTPAPFKPSDEIVSEIDISMKKALIQTKKTLGEGELEGPFPPIPTLPISAYPSSITMSGSQYLAGTGASKRSMTSKNMAIAMKMSAMIAKAASADKKGGAKPKPNKAKKGEEEKAPPPPPIWVYTGDERFKGTSFGVPNREAISLGLYSGPAGVDSIVKKKRQPKKAKKAGSEPCIDIEKQKHEDRVISMLNPAAWCSLHNFGIMRILTAHLASEESQAIATGVSALEISNSVLSQKLPLSDPIIGQTNRNCEVASALCIRQVRSEELPVLEELIKRTYSALKPKKGKKKGKKKKK